MTKKKIISVITVTYNAQLGIEKTIKSVLKQKTDEIEFIIIDGGSVDDTLLIINKYVNSIDLFISEKDKGLYDAMNKGINYAKGEYIIFLNADDVFHDTDVLRDVIDFLKLSKKTIDVLYGNAAYDLKDRIFYTKPAKIELLETEMIFSHQSVFVKKTVLDTELFDLKYKYVADYNQLSNLYLKRCVFSFFDRVISISATESGLTFENVYKSIREHYSIPRIKARKSSFYKMYKMLFLKKMVELKRRFKKLLFVSYGRFMDR